MSYILFFDSGVGGISVLKEAIRLYPRDNYIYYADNKNLPYGDKDMDTIRDLTVSAVSKVIEKYSVKAVVIACNTATSAAVRHLRAMYDNIPIIGIEPAIKPACEANAGGKVAVLATEATLRQPKFQSLTDRYSSIAEIYPIPCPGLVDFIERGVFEGQELTEFLYNIKKPYKDVKFDAVVLGCTHYPFIKKTIGEVFDCQMVIDGGVGTVNNLFRQVACERDGERIFINSADLEDFEEKVKLLLSL